MIKFKLSGFLTIIIFISSCNLIDSNKRKNINSFSTKNYDEIKDKLIKIVDFGFNFKFLLSDDAKKYINFLESVNKLSTLNNSFNQIDNRFKGKINDQSINLIKTCSFIDSIKNFASPVDITPSAEKMCTAGLSISNLTEEKLNQLCGHLFTASINLGASGKVTINKEFSLSEKDEEESNNPDCELNKSKIALPITKTSLCSYDKDAALVTRAFSFFRGDNKPSINYNNCKIILGSNSSIDSALGKTTRNDGEYLTPGLYKISIEALCTSNDINSCKTSPTRNYIFDKFKQTYDLNSNRNHIFLNDIFVKDNEKYVFLPPIGEVKRNLSHYEISISQLFNTYNEKKSLENQFSDSYKKIEQQCIQ